MTNSIYDFTGVSEEVYYPFWYCFLIRSCILTCLSTERKASVSHIPVQSLCKMGIFAPPDSFISPVLHSNLTYFWKTLSVYSKLETDTHTLSAIFFVTWTFYVFQKKNASCGLNLYYIRNETKVENLLRLRREKRHSGSVQVFRNLPHLITKLFVMYSVIHKGVFAPLRDVTVRIIKVIDHSSDSIMEYRFTKS